MISIERLYDEVVARRVRKLHRPPGDLPDRDTEGDLR
jgi:hypothetical protein